MKVNMAVCGKFHVLNYALFDNLNDSIQNIYISSRNVVDNKKVLNFGLKELLVQAHGQIPFKPLYENLLPFYHNIWASSVIKKWNNCDILHLISHGAGNDLIALASKNKSKILLEVVNTHPEYRLNKLNSECEYFGLKKRKSLYDREYKICKEAENADYLLAPSKIVADSYKDYFDENKIFILPYCANVNRFKPKREYFFSGRKIKILCVGQIGLRKGQLHLLESVKKLSNIFDITLVGQVDNNVKKILKYYNPFYKHISRVPAELMPSVMQEHDVFALPSLEEGLSVSILEAMASGLPVIASKESGASEVIENNKNGIILNKVTAHDIQISLEQICDIKERERLGVAAARSTLNTSNWKSYAKSLNNIYKEIYQEF